MKALFSTGAALIAVLSLSACSEVCTDCAGSTATVAPPAASGNFKTPPFTVAGDTAAVATTPVAVHAGVPVPGSLVGSVSNAVVYNGYNGVRPVLIQPGSKWHGPATYMLPVGTGNYVTQHTPIETVGVSYSTGGSRATAQKDLFMRKTPSFSGEKCDVLKQGVTADLIECSGKWCKVSYKGRTGWSSRKYLSIN